MKKILYKILGIDDLITELINFQKDKYKIYQEMGTMKKDSVLNTKNKLC